MNWQGAALGPPQIDDGSIEILTELMFDIDDYFGGDTAAAGEAVRTGMLE
jgi:hypothetical protein